MYFVYILYSKVLNSYYVGFTSVSVEVRLNKHLSNHKGYTSRAKDWEIAYSEQFEIKSNALSREKEIKSWKSRIKIEALIGKNRL